MHDILENHLKVYPYVLISTDPANEAEFLAPETEQDDGIYSNAYANNGKGTSWWVRIGNENGYALDANQTISLETGKLYFDSTNEQLKQEITSGKINLNKSIRQVRWVIRTEGFTETISGTQVELTDAEAPRYFPVPKGLYMNADADDAEEGRQDRNDVDKDHYGLYL